MTKGNDAREGVWRGREGHEETKKKHFVDPHGTERDKETRASPSKQRADRQGQRQSVMNGDRSKRGFHWPRPYYLTECAPISRRGVGGAAWISRHLLQRSIFFLVAPSPVLAGGGARLVRLLVADLGLFRQAVMTFCAAGLG